MTLLTRYYTNPSPNSIIKVQKKTTTFTNFPIIESESIINDGRGS